MVSPFFMFKNVCFFLFYSYIVYYAPLKNKQTPYFCSIKTWRYKFKQLLNNILFVRCPEILCKTPMPAEHREQPFAKGRTNSICHQECNFGTTHCFTNPE